MEKIKLAIIGTGGMAKAHGDAFSAMDNVEIVACCDILEERAKAFAEKYNIPHYYTDFNELYEKEKLTAVSVVTSDKFHKAPSIEALKRNIHCMCEKPLADNLENAKEMSDLAEEKLKEGIFTAVDFSYRNSFATQKLAEMVQSGEFGKVIAFDAHYRQSWVSTKIWGDFRTSSAFQWRMSTKHGSLGTMGDTGVHIYDLTRFVCGDFDEIFCQLDCYDKDVNQVGEYVFDANETMYTIAKLKCGGRGTVDSSRWSTGYANEVSIQVFCEKGGFDLNLDRVKGGQLRACINENRDKGVWEIIACPETPDMWTRFIDSIIEGKQGQTSFKGAYEVQKLLDASIKSNEKQGFVKL
ncbi:MAG: Gfo/Idh/MocA family oxidoreductase [Abditibacteriota bacterium]|nr:Gfo/Idh/MocA family oxidoreductase [Abditibacteriota bacterium]